MKSSKIHIPSIKDLFVLISSPFILKIESFARFLTTSSVNDRGVRRDGDGDDLVADVSDDDDSNNDAADALAVDIAVDDPDTDADLVAGFDDNGDSADEYTDAPAGNTAADGECDGDDSNGEGNTNDKGDCDIDCNRV